MKPNYKNLVIPRAFAIQAEGWPELGNYICWVCWELLCNQLGKLLPWCSTRLSLSMQAKGSLCSCQGRNCGNLFWNVGIANDLHLGQELLRHPDLWDEVFDVRDHFLKHLEMSNRSVNPSRSARSRKCHFFWDTMANENLSFAAQSNHAEGNTPNTMPNTCPQECPQDSNWFLKGY